MLPLRKVTKTIHKYVALLCCIVYNVVFCSVSLSRASHALKDQYSNS